MGYAYVVDFDGTITSADISYELAVYFGGAAYREIENSYRHREIPMKEWLRQSVRLLPPDLELLHDKAMEWAEIRPGFKPFLDHARKQSARVIVASDGFGFYIEPVLKKFGLLEQVDHIYSNYTVLGKSGNLEVIKPHAHPICPVCGNCKAAHVVGIKEEGLPVIYIGDGTNDCYAASWSDLICARDRLAAFCREFNLAYSPWSDFYDIIDLEKPELKDCSPGALCFPRGSGVKSAQGDKH